MEIPNGRKGFEINMKISNEESELHHCFETNILQIGRENHNNNNNKDMQFFSFFPNPPIFRYWTDGLRAWKQSYDSPVPHPQSQQLSSSLGGGGGSLIARAQSAGNDTSSKHSHVSLTQPHAYVIIKKSHFF